MIVEKSAANSSERCKLKRIDLQSISQMNVIEELGVILRKPGEILYVYINMFVS